MSKNQNTVAPNNFVSTPPLDPRLKECISHYYFHWSDSPDFFQQFIYYPHYKNALTTYWNSEVCFNQQMSAVSPKSDNSILSIYSKIQPGPITVSLKGPFYKFGIVFNPLGINAFLSASLQDLFPQPISLCAMFQERWKEDIPRLWKQAIEDRVRFLDAFLVNHLQADLSGEHLLLLKKLLEDPSNFTLKDAAAQVFVSPKTVSRWFKDQLGCTFSNYKKVARFRLALENFHHKNPKNLTELAFLSQFYDQPDFNRNLKSMSGKHPRKLFNSLKDLGQDTFWTFS